MFRTYEQCLDPAARDARMIKRGELGVERQRQKVILESDCSGQGYHWMYERIDAGVEARHLFNEQEKDAFADQTMLISNGEFAPMVEALPFIIRDVPDLLRVVSQMDNSVVEENLESKSAGNPTNLECLLVVEVISWIFGIDVESIRVKSEDNIRTDAGSRPDLFDEYVKQMREWSALKGKPVVQVEVPPSWKERRTWLQSKHEITPEERVKMVLRKIKDMVNWLRKEWGHVSECHTPR